MNKPLLLFLGGIIGAIAGVSLVSAYFLLKPAIIPGSTSGQVPTAQTSSNDTNAPTGSPDQMTRTFNVLGGFNSYGDFASKYSVGNGHAYYDGRVMNGADPVTLHVLKGSLQEMHGFITYAYAADSHSVYFQGMPLSNANVSAFRPIENGAGTHSYGTDGQRVFYYAASIPWADPKTFSVLWDNLWEGCPETTYSKDAIHVFFDSLENRTSQVVQGADPASFKSLISGYGKDSRGYYKGAVYVGPTLDANEMSKLDCPIG